mmetsp:Transcript_62144/g.133626  ORF Transcript_62144/g.133626 Transcript_62144/m.133626 type:complete len:122 (-) Transcript_62144:96-461(-)
MALATMDKDLIYDGSKTTIGYHAETQLTLEHKDGVKVFPATGSGPGFQAQKNEQTSPGMFYSKTGRTRIPGRYELNYEQPDIPEEVVKAMDRMNQRVADMEAAIRAQEEEDKKAFTPGGEE